MSDKFKPLLESLVRSGEGRINGVLQEIASKEAKSEVKTVAKTQTVGAFCDALYTHLDKEGLLSQRFTREVQKEVGARTQTAGNKSAEQINKEIRPVVAWNLATGLNDNKKIVTNAKEAREAYGIGILAKRLGVANTEDKAPDSDIVERVLSGISALTKSVTYQKAFVAGVTAAKKCELDKASVEISSVEPPPSATSFAQRDAGDSIRARN